MTSFTRSRSRVSAADWLPDIGQWSGVTPLSGSSDQLISMLRILEDLSALEENWDTYGSPAITREAKESAGWLARHVALLNVLLPHVCAVPGGGLQFEWAHNRRELELEIMPDGAFEYLVVTESGATDEGRLPEQPFSQVNELLSWLLSRDEGNLNSR